MECDGARRNGQGRPSWTWSSTIVAPAHQFVQRLFVGHADPHLLSMNFQAEDDDPIPRNPPLFQAVLACGSTSEDGIRDALSSAVRKSTHAMLLVKPPKNDIINTRNDATTGRESVQAGGDVLRHCNVNDVGMYAGRRLTSFHLAVLQDKVTAARVLHSLDGSVLKWSSQEPLYRGETALHVAVMNAVRSTHWSSFTELLNWDYGMDSGQASLPQFAAVADASDDMLALLAPLYFPQNANSSSHGRRHQDSLINSLCASGCYFHCKTTINQVNLGSSPLSFAVCLLLPRVVDYLVQHGASMDTADCQGNNLLHLLALQHPGGKTSSKRLKLMCEFVKRLSCKQSGCDHGRHDRHCLEKQLNKKGMTPLHVAAANGNYEVLEYFLNSPSCCHQLITYGNRRLLAYDLEFLDIPLAAGSDRRTSLQFTCTPKQQQQQQQQQQRNLHGNGRKFENRSAQNQVSQPVQYHVADESVVSTPVETGLPLPSNNHAIRCDDVISESWRHQRSLFPSTLLEVIISSSNHQAYELLTKQPIQQLLDLKWMQYGFVGFSVLFLYNLLYVAVISLVVYYRPVELTVCGVDSTASNPSPSSFPPLPLRILNSSSVTSAGGDNNQSTLCTPVYRMRSGLAAYSSTADHVRLAGEAFVVLNTLIQIGLEIHDVCRLNMRILHYDLVARGTWFTVFKWLYLVLILVVVALRSLHSEYEDVVLSWIVIMAWTYALIYGRCFKPLAHHLLSVKEILRKDIPRFCFIFLQLLLSFSLVFYLLFRESGVERPLQFSTLPQTAMTLFRMALGLADVNVDDIQQTKHQTWVYIYVVAFLVLSYLLMINFLIATMQHRQDKLLPRSQVLCKALVAASIVFVERRIRWLIPKRLLEVGRRGEELGLTPGKRYLCLSVADNEVESVNEVSSN